MRGVRQSETFPDMARARAWARVVEGELGAHARGEVVHRSVWQALERYADEVAPKHRGERWERVRLGKLGRTLPFIRKRMADVTSDDIGRWRDSLAVDLAPASARREYGLLRAVFAVACKEWGMLPRSPFDGVAPPPEGRPRTRGVSDAEAGAIAAALGYVDGAKPETAQHFVALAFLLALETAMRQGEILTLDQESKRGRVLHLDRTKNGDERDVPLSTRAAAIVALLPGDGYLFPITSGTCDALFRRARDAAGVDGLHFHDSRREATTRLSRRVDVLTLAKITGHRDVRVLLKTYYAPDMAAVADRLG